MTSKIIELCQSLTWLWVLIAILSIGIISIKYYEWKEKKKNPFPDWPKAEKPNRNWRDNVLNKK